MSSVVGGYDAGNFFVTEEKTVKCVPHQGMSTEPVHDS